MLQDLRHDLTLRTGILLAHRSIHQFDNVLVEMRYEMVEVFVVGLGLQSLAANPLDGVSETVQAKSHQTASSRADNSLLHVRRFDLIRQSFVT